MYKWVIPPEMLSRLWRVKQRTGVPIARQIREAVQAYLGQAEAGAAEPEPSCSSRKEKPS
jgi:predicted DNA-binding protein